MTFEDSIRLLNKTVMTQLAITRAAIKTTAMQAANSTRKCEGCAPAYGEESFDEVYEELNSDIEKIYE